MQPLAERFVADALRNPFNRAILARLPALQLPDAWPAAAAHRQGRLARWARAAFASFSSKVASGALSSAASQR